MKCVGDDLITSGELLELGISEVGPGDCLGTGSVVGLAIDVGSNVENSRGTVGVALGVSLGCTLAPGDPVGATEMPGEAVGSTESLGSIIRDGSEVELVGTRGNEGVTSTLGS